MELEKRILSTNDAGLIAILYEALIDNFNKSIKVIEEKEFEKLNEITNHSRDILTELMVQFGGKDQVSKYITEISLYLNRLITEGEYEKNPFIYKNCIKIATPILEAFKELEIKSDPKTVAGLTYGKNTLDEYSFQNNKTFEG
jgi:flagellin-specific chaperone FliS